MVVKVAVKEAQNSLTELISRVIQEGDRVVLETQGKPQAALVSVADLQALQAVENKEALERERRALQHVLNELREAVDAHEDARVKELLEDLDDWMAMANVSDQPTRSWEEFTAELDADVSPSHPK